MRLPSIIPAITVTFFVAGCDSKPKKPTTDECSTIAENVAKVTEVPLAKAKVYNECKDASLPYQWVAYRCFGNAKTLADMDRCKEVAAKHDPAVEAETNIARLFDAVSGYFQAEHPGEGLEPHRCAHQSKDAADASSKIIPPLDVACGKGPDGKCVPTESPSKPYEYAASAWEDEEVFGALGFKLTEPHYFHYGVRAANMPGNGYGACQFTVQAFGDLDDDSVFSTFERAGAADQNGLNTAAGLYIDQKTE